MTTTEHSRLAYDAERIQQLATRRQAQAAAFRAAGQRRKDTDQTAAKPDLQNGGSE